MATFIPECVLPINRYKCEIIKCMEFPLCHSIVFFFKWMNNVYMKHQYRNEAYTIITLLYFMRLTGEWQWIFVVVVVSLFTCSRATFRPFEVPLFAGIGNLSFNVDIFTCSIRYTISTLYAVICLILKAFVMRRTIDNVADWHIWQKSRNARSESILLKINL